MDDAGNRADFITAGGVIDEVAPTASVLTPATLEAGERTTFSAFVSDNLDLNQVAGFFAVGENAYLVTSESVGSPSLPFEQSTTSSGSIESLPAGIGDDAVTGFFAMVTDQAGNVGTDEALVPAGTFSPVDITDGAQDTETAGRTITYDEAAATVEDAALCWDTDNDGCADNTKTRTTVDFTIDAQEAVTGTMGDHDMDPDTPDTDSTPDSEGFEGLVNPFERVVFYVQVAGLTPAGAVNSVWVAIGEGRGRAPTNDPENDDSVTRQFTWRLTVRAEDLGMATGRMGEQTANVVIPVRAVGYTEDGNAVSPADDVTITLSNEGEGNN